MRTLRYGVYKDYTICILTNDINSFFSSQPHQHSLSFDFCSFPAGVMRAGFLRQRILHCTLLRDHRTEMLKMRASFSRSLFLTCFISISSFLKMYFAFSYVSICVPLCGYMHLWPQGPGEGQDSPGLEFQALISCPTWALTAPFQSSAGAAPLLTTSTSFTLKERKPLPVQSSFTGAGEGGRTRRATHRGTCVTAT